MEKRKYIEVAAAVITEADHVFAARRGYGKYKGFWEFPGGKIEAGETPEEAVQREIREELGIEIEVGKLHETVKYSYPEFDLRMYCYLCAIKSGEPVQKEHEAFRWLGAQDIESVQWLPANLELIQRIKKKGI